MSKRPTRTRRAKPAPVATAEPVETVAASEAAAEPEALAAMASEGAQDAPQGDPAPEAAPEAPGPDPEALAAVLRPAIATLGTIACRMADVETLAADEVEALAGAGAGVLALYDLARLDPRTLAWCNLGIVAVAIAGPRLMVIADRRRGAAGPMPAGIPEPKPAVLHTAEPAG